MKKSQKQLGEGESLQEALGRTIRSYGVKEFCDLSGLEVIKVQKVTPMCLNSCREAACCGRSTCHFIDVTMKKNCNDFSQKPRISLKALNKALRRLNVEGLPLVPSSHA